MICPACNEHVEYVNDDTGFCNICSVEEQEQTLEQLPTRTTRFLHGTRIAWKNPTNFGLSVKYGTSVQNRDGGYAHTHTWVAWDVGGLEHINNNELTLESEEMVKANDQPC